MKLSLAMFFAVILCSAVFIDCHENWKVDGEVNNRGEWKANVGKEIKRGNKEFIFNAQANGRGGRVEDKSMNLKFKAEF